MLSAVILKIGFRKTIIIGAISTSLGLILSSFAINVFWLYITFGIIAGIKDTYLQIYKSRFVHLNFRQSLKQQSFVNNVSCAAGTGSGCVYQSVCTAVPVYFEKYRSGIPCVVPVLRHCYDIDIGAIN